MAYTYLHCHGQQIFGLSIHTPCCSRLIKLGEFRNYKGWPQASVLDRKLRRVVGVLHVCYLLPCWSSLQAWGLTQMSILLELSFHQILLEGQTFVHLIFISNFGRRIFILLPARTARCYTKNCPWRLRHSLTLRQALSEGRLAWWISGSIFEYFWMFIEII